MEFQIDGRGGVRSADDMFRCLFAFSALILTTRAEEVSKTFFDLPLVAGATIRPEALEDMLPVSVFSIRKDMDAKALIAVLSDCQMDSINDPSFSPWVSGETPENAYFEYIEGHWEKGRIRNVTLSARRLPPTEGHLLSLVKEFEKLLGTPTAAYREIRYERVDPLSLMLEWRKEPDCVRLAMKRDGLQLELKLTYYPGPANPGMARSDAALKPEPLAFGSLGELMAGFTKEIAFLPPGDGPRPPLPLPVGEKDMLAAYSMSSVLKNRDWKMHLAPFRERLNEALLDHYADLTLTQRYERVLKIAEGKEPGLSSGEVQVGAATFLGSHDDPKVIDYLLKGMDVELPSGVEMECAAGIARQSTGEMMDRIIAMFDVPDQWDKATSILAKLDTPEQLKELKTKARKANHPIRSRLNDIISLLERHEGME